MCVLRLRISPLILLSILHNLRLNMALLRLLRIFLLLLLLFDVLLVV